jgi:hypothetical protein
VPNGELARTADEAITVAKRIGYPVVLKAQAAALSHKTEAGGVIITVATRGGFQFNSEPRRDATGFRINSPLQAHRTN